MLRCLKHANPRYHSMVNAVSTRTRLLLALVRPTDHAVGELASEYTTEFVRFLFDRRLAVVLQRRLPLPNTNISDFDA